MKIRNRKHLNIRMMPLNRSWIALSAQDSIL